MLTKKGTTLMDRLLGNLRHEIARLEEAGTAKGAERVVTGFIRGAEGRADRVQLEGEPGRSFLRMNSNSYLGLSTRPELVLAEEEATRRFGVGPGAVRFISGTYEPHVRLERLLADFHGREAGMIFSSAYATAVSVIVPLTTPDTALVSDELNHNCIINAMRLSRPKAKFIYRHLDLDHLREQLEAAVASGASRCLVVTDGIFSMRGVHAPLAEIRQLLEGFRDRFAGGLSLIVDDSHGVAAVGLGGRGTEELTDSGPSDILIGTLGKGFGVNGGYVVGPQLLIDYLRQTSMMYIYSNPITPGEAAAACAAVELVDSEEGRRLLATVRERAGQFRAALEQRGLESLPGQHPVVPLMIRDTPRTVRTVQRLFEGGVLATGLTYPVVPAGDESIRFQLSAEHGVADVDEVAALLGGPV